jgi:hypothetical protein
VIPTGVVLSGVGFVYSAKAEQQIGPVHRDERGGFDVL